MILFNSLIKLKNIIYLGLVSLAFFSISACSPPNYKATSASYETGAIGFNAVTPPLGRYEGLNEKRDPITIVKLGIDILVPQPLKEDVMPSDIVGPYELRGETLASALQLILDGYDISIAFESDVAFKRRITVSNLRGKLKDVIARVCSLANLYCHFESDNLTIKRTETFVVDLPPIGKMQSAAISVGNNNDKIISTVNTAYQQIAAGLEAVIGEKPTVDASTRIMIYTATQRSNKYAKEYFDRLRKNTALIVFETNIWEVTLNKQNIGGINWNKLYEGSPEKDNIEKLNQTSSSPAYTGSGNFSTNEVHRFIAARGEVKTISQPQITVLSGSSATLSVSKQENFVSGISRTLGVNGGGDTISTKTGTVNTGLTMTVNSAWDNSTVYGRLNIVLEDLLHIENFQPDSKTTIQLPQTTRRSLQTEVRVRPGDAILIGGLVAEKDDFSNAKKTLAGGFFGSPEKIEKKNTELVFLLRPRVVVFVQGDAKDTPAIIDAPSSGVAIRTPILPNITDRVKGLFSRVKNGSMSNFTNKIKSLFKKENPNNLSEEEINTLAPKVSASIDKHKFGKPVANPRDLLNSPQAVAVGKYD